MHMHISLFRMTVSLEWFTDKMVIPGSPGQREDIGFDKQKDAIV